MLRAAVVLVAMAAVPSAPAADAGDGQVSGLVTVDGAPLAAGRVIFHLDGGQFVGSAVKDGKYAVDRVPAGARRVTIEGAGVPPKYTGTDTTPLTADVKAGKATLNWAVATK